MSRRIARTSKEVCQLCDFISAKSIPRRPLQTAPKFRSTTRQFCTGSRLLLQNSGPLSAKDSDKTKRTLNTTPSQQNHATGTHATQAELDTALSAAQEACNALLALDRIPHESETLWALRKCETLTNLILSYGAPSPPNSNGSVSSLLQLDSSSTKTTSLPKAPPSLQPLIDNLSNLAYKTITHPTVFIAPEILELYTLIQASLHQPQTLPEIFHLYANKPLPRENTSPVQYTSQNPNKVGNAIPKKVADLALRSAIEAKQLTTAMDLIETTYSTPSFRRAKFVRKGLLPFTGLAVAPVAAYTVASQLAQLQSTMDTQLATNVAFTGLIAYVGFTATIGIVAITTANDQMERVTWAQGMPLRERWVREEERASCDKVAQAWGFSEVWRRGEEEGGEWEALREWVGQRGMILDAAELMEGME